MQQYFSVRAQCIRSDSASRVQRHAAGATPEARRWLFFRFCSADIKINFAVNNNGFNRITAFNCTFKHLFGDSIFNLWLNSSFQRSCTVNIVISCLCNSWDCLIREICPDTKILKPFWKSVKKSFGYLSDIWLTELFEYDNIIDSVEKLRLEPIRKEYDEDGNPIFDEDEDNDDNEDNEDGLDGDDADESDDTFYSSYSEEAEVKDEDEEGFPIEEE